MFLIFLFVILSNSKISCFNPGCLTCDEESRDYNCTTCKNDYLFVNSVCVPKNIVHCVETTNSKCSKCEAGYYYDYYYSTCKSGYEYCLDFTVDPLTKIYTCNKCVPGFIFNTTSKMCNICSLTDKDVQSCLHFVSPCVCDECPPNTYLQDGKCLNDDAYCALYDENHKCVSCAIGYALSNNKCIRGSDKNCVEYEEGSTSACKTCQKGMALDTNTKLCQYDCGDDNCINCTNYKECEECFPGSVNINGRCKVCKTDNCYTCSNEDTCIDCRDGYVLDPNTNLCVACEEGCELCNADDTSICQSCDFNHNLYEGKCYSYPQGSKFVCNTEALTEDDCLRNNSNCEFVSGENYHYCLYKGSNCAEYDVDGICITCDDGYVKQSENATKCISEIPFCLQRDDYTLANGTVINVCVQCESGAFLTVDRQCKKCNLLCSNGCVGAMDNCVKTTCYQSNCLECSEYKKCTKCAPGYRSYQKFSITGIHVFCESDRCEHATPNVKQHCLICAHAYDGSVGANKKDRYYERVYDSTDGLCYYYSKPKDNTDMSSSYITGVVCFVTTLVIIIVLIFIGGGFEFVKAGREGGYQQVN
ncbi:hypothetical protein EIN_094190 [Entamoeba invadens IP1]|uniref:TNFR-Cys domain-containing protein n=1 Tax=Entamoeba invadens IP1 TaxID=370355 RepID=A0A0A1U017_ENTIV|nr:hypothetical protein EIN_094190 [Entamoeba invadens IP1]ELP87232.1 hypothetical protein EIN_094190 [Entamoeba invadens IP1]|eukprot:XP_004254003.1 hypothetical protein EIN_094190 [Entamoeba invadens IP1]